MNISQITEQLFVGAHPNAEDAEAIHAIGIKGIISMVRFRRPPRVLEQPPFRLLWLQTTDTFFTPIPLRKLRQGVEFALPVIRSGGKVLVYCVQGRHRSVAMAAAILIGMGYDAEAAMDLLERQRREADPRAWHIKRQIKRFERLWKKDDSQIRMEDLDA